MTRLLYKKHIVIYLLSTLYIMPFTLYCNLRFVGRRTKHE